MNRKTCGTTRDLMKSYRAVVLVVLATVALLLASPRDAQAAETGMTAETKLVDLPLWTAADSILQAAVASSHRTQTFSKMNEGQIRAGTSAAVEKPIQLKARMAASPYFDAHAIGMQVKIAF